VGFSFCFHQGPGCATVLRMTSADQNRVERRLGQRFPYQLPVTLRVTGETRTGSGFTQDLSSRGAMLWTDLSLAEGQMIEMTLVMPSEITLADDMNVCCRARVMRCDQVNGGKPAVAVHIEHYDFLRQEPPVLEEHAAKDMPLVRP
jgi:PilZ domain